MVEFNKDHQKQMFGEIWASTEAYDNLVFMCDEFGTRFGGTPGESKAIEFIAQKFMEYGLENVTKEPFEYTGWWRGSARLSVNKPIQHKLEVISLVQSPSTSAEGVTGELVYVGDGTPAEFEAKWEEIDGRICMATSATPSSFPRWIHRREKYGRAMDAGAIGFIFMNHIPGYLPPTGSLRTNALGELPAIGISKEDGSVLLRLHKKEPVVITIQIDNKSHPTTSYFVSADLPGRHYPDRILLVGGHLDSHDISPGAGDNAAGISIILEAARVLSIFKDIPKKTIRFVCFPVEEMAVTGSSIYVQNHKSELINIEFMLNIDGGGGPGRKLFNVHGCEEIVPYIQRYGREIGYPLKVERMVQVYSDNFPFLVQGIPTLDLSESRSPLVSGRGFGHTKADTVDKMDSINLKEAVMVVSSFLIQASAEKSQIGRHRSQEEIVQILKKANLEETLKIQRQWPFKI